MLPKIALIAYPQCQPLLFGVPHMIFSYPIEEQKLFELKIVAEDPPPFIPVDAGLEAIEQADIVVVPGWHDFTQPPSQALIQALQQANQRGAMLVSLCYGAYALAYAGILDGKKAVTHWLADQDFRARFPCIQLDTKALYIEQDNIITSAGSMASVDCCLAIVRRFYGVKIANKMARLLVASPHREGGQAQFIEQPLAKRSGDQSINQLLDKLLQDLHQSYQIDQLATQLNMSRSTFTRHFKKATGMSVNQWLIEARLQRARDLLEGSNLSIEQIAEQAGFHSTSALRQHFQQKHQISPSAWRKGFVG